VQLDLAFRLPQPTEVDACDQRHKQPGVSPVPKTYRHAEG
jgi:hypothetical protein